MQEIKANIGKDHYQTIIQSNSLHILADEPASNGGKELGFSPSQLLASSLGACTCITLRMYADRKEWNMESVMVNVYLERVGATQSTQISREIQFAGQLDEEQKRRLMQIAENCPVHKMLTGKIGIESKLLN